MFRKVLAVSAGASAGDCGKYFIIRSNLSNHVLDLAGGCTDNNTSVTTAEETGADSQMWYYDVVKQTIRNKSTDYCFNLDFHKSLIVSAYDEGAEDQKWMVDGDMIIHLTSGKALDIASADSGTGARLIVYDKHGHPNQKWTLQYQGKTYFFIKSKFNGRVVDVAGDSAEPGTEVIMYSQKKKKKESVDNQLWFEDMRGVIRSKLGPMGGYALDSSDGDIKTAVYDPSNEHHIWVRQGDKIVNGPAHPNLVLDIKGKKRLNGGNLIGYEDKGSDNQRWEFITDEED